MLLLLQGETVKIPAPKDIYNEDNMISTGTAVFATRSSIKYKGCYNASNDEKTKLVAAR